MASPAADACIRLTAHFFALFSDPYNPIIRISVNLTLLKNLDMGCIQSSQRNHSPSYSRHTSQDHGVEQQEAASRAVIVDNLRAARGFGSLFRKTTRMTTQINGLYRADSSHWAPLHNQVNRFHAELDQRIASGEGDSLDTFTERFNTLQQRFQSGG